MEERAEAAETLPTCLQAAMRNEAGKWKVAWLEAVMYEGFPAISVRIIGDADRIALGALSTRTSHHLICRPNSGAQVNQKTIIPVETPKGPRLRSIIGPSIGE